MLPTSAGVEPATSWSPVGRCIQLSHRGRPVRSVNSQSRDRKNSEDWPNFVDTTDRLPFSPTFTYMYYAFCPCGKNLSHITTLVLGTIHLKMGKEESIMNKSMQDREISPEGQEFQPGTRLSSSLVEIPTSRVRFPYPAWALMIDSYNLPPLPIWDRLFFFFFFFFHVRNFYLTWRRWS